jgi:titin
MPQITYPNTGLQCETSYYYRVRAYRSGDGRFSAYSNVASAATGTCPPPLAPSGLTAAPTLLSTHVNLAWVDNSSDETAFHIERSPAGQNTWTQLGTVGFDQTAYIDIGAACFTAYDYRVLAALQHRLFGLLDIANVTSAVPRRMRRPV